MMRVAFIFSLLPAAMAVKTQPIAEAMASKGWCVGFDKGPAVPADTAEKCLINCKASHPSTIAADFWPTRQSGKNCWCQDKCDCLAPSLVGGGTGILIMDDNVTVSSDYCYKMLAGVGKNGWCAGMDSGPDASTTPTSPKECFDACKAKYSGTIAVDFWHIDHPERNANNICWCQDACDCTLPSKSDAGSGWLFVQGNATKGDSCGFDMKTVIDGNDASVCSDPMSAPSSPAANMYDCQKKCAANGDDVATWFKPGFGSNATCKCQKDCSCLKADKGRGYRFVPETMHNVHMCDAQMECGDLKKAYKSGQCCGNPMKVAKLR